MALKGTVTNLDNPRIRFLDFFLWPENWVILMNTERKTALNAVYACAQASAALSRNITLQKPQGLIER